MSTLVGSSWRPDGEVRYRIDPVTGDRVGIMPATCKRGAHSLRSTGYEAREVDGELRISCTACNQIPHPDYAWVLTLTGPAVSRAEMDDGPYSDIYRHFILGPGRLNRAPREDNVTG